MNVNMCLHHNPSSFSSLPPLPFLHSRLFSLLPPPLSQGYLTHNGKVNLPRVQLILTGIPFLQEPSPPCLCIDLPFCSTELGKVEDEIFKKRREKELEFRRRDQAKRRRFVSPNSEYTHTFYLLFADCIHTYIHTYIHIHIHTDIHTYIHACIHTYMIHTCIHTYIHTYIHAYIHT